jgi:hypothetical protein
MTEPAAAKQTQLGATRLKGWRERVLHLAALAVGWAMFFWGWYDVSGQPWDTTVLKWLLGGSLVILPLFTIAWILHNVGIHRRKGPRTRLREVDDSYLHDWNGREICADLTTVRSAPIVVIRIEGGRKVYTAAGKYPASPVVTTIERTAFRRPDTLDSEAAGVRTG